MPYQNYFRLYDKLSGMTGTALTEATEFMKIYELPVVQIPTNMPMVRHDRNDQVYKTKDGKSGGAAGARRHDLGGGLGAALRQPDQEGDQAHGAEPQARARRARGRDDRRG